MSGWGAGVVSECAITVICDTIMINHIRPLVNKELVNTHPAASSGGEESEGELVLAQLIILEEGKWLPQHRHQSGVPWRRGRGGG